MILAEIGGSNPATGSGRYYTQDNIQSTRGVFNGAAASLGSFEYTPFGSAYTPGGPTDVTHRYTGLDLDPLTGQYYAPYRYYDPGITRWLTRDPLGMVDGPNVYAYVTTSILSATDKLGLCDDNGGKHRHPGESYLDCVGRRLNECLDALGGTPVDAACIAAALCCAAIPNGFCCVIAAACLGRGAVCLFTALADCILEDNS